MPIYTAKVSETGQRGELVSLGEFTTSHEARIAIERRLDVLHPGNWIAFNETQYTRLDDPIAGPIAILETTITAEDNRRRQIARLNDDIEHARAVIERAEAELRTLQGDK